MGSNHIAPQFLNLPLLPFEKQLIAALGCTKEEYVRYRAEVYSAKYVRPAEYDLVPDIRCDPTTIIVNLVIGALLTAASVLLAPKPPEPEEEKEAVELASKTGRSKFGATQNIDVAQEVATLGQTVPILFGNYRPSGSGGIFAPAQLVWSRMYSYGNEQIFKGLFCIGEAVTETTQSLPDIEGIYIGQLAADVLTAQQLAVYWSVGRPKSTVKENFSQKGWAPAPSGTGDPDKQSLLFGTRKLQTSADPAESIRGDSFLCPVGEEEEAPGFSQTISISNNAEFGVYSPVANGTTYKLNYQIVPLGDSLDGKAENLAKDRRRRIAGKEQEQREDGQAGIGRGYTPLMGVSKLIREDGTEVERTDCKWTQYDELNKVKKGDKLIFHIDKRAPSKKGGVENYALNREETDCEEMRGMSERQREAADDMLHIGQMVMIGRTIWQVTDRKTTDKNDKYGKLPYEMEQRDSEDQLLRDGVGVDIKLEYKETTGYEGNSVISLPGKLAISDNAICYEGKGDPYTDNTGILGGYVPNFFYPLCRFKIATYRNTRPVDVTEIGIESVVYNRASGLCNFQGLPKPNVLEDYDDDDVTVREGRLSAFFERTSVFLLQCRPITEGGRKEYDWENMKEQFAITGRTDQSMFNYLRIRHNQRSQMEFRLVPKPAVDIITLGAEAEMLQLDAANGEFVGKEFKSSKGYGNFAIYSTGRYINIRDHLDNKELQSQGYKQKNSDTVGWPTFAVRRDFAPASEEKGRHQAFLFEVFGDVRDEDVGKIKDRFVDIDDSADGRLYIKVKCEKVDWDNYIKWYGFKKAWVVLEYGEVRKGYDVKDTFKVTKLCSADNVYAKKWGYSSAPGDTPKAAGWKMTATKYETIAIDPSKNAPRSFDKYSQVAELSHYDGLSKSCDTRPEHRISYVNESLGIHDAEGIEESVWDNAASYFNMQMLGLSLRSNNQLQNLSQVRVWLPNGVECNRLAEGETGPSNLFPDAAYWLLTNDLAGLGSFDSNVWLDKESFKISAKFCKENKIFFDGAISDKVNIRQFLSEQAPLNLLTFSLANGKMALLPALPYDPVSFKIKPKEVIISNIFTLGNIVEGSYAASYTDVSDRAPIRAVMTWREGIKNSMPNKDSKLIRYDENWPGNGPSDPPLTFVSPPNRAPQQTFDLSQWVSNEDQAMMVGRYLLALRQRVTHRVNFKTTPYGLNIGPGKYIKIDVPEVPTSPSAIGVIGADGKVLTDLELTDGDYDLLVYQRQNEAVERTTITIANGVVEDPALWGSVFSSLTPDSSATTYLVEEVNIDEDGLVDIKASHFPTAGEGNQIESLIAKDVLDLDGRFFTRS